MSSIEVTFNRRRVKGDVIVKNPPRTRAELDALADLVNACNARWVDGGNQLASWTCASCNVAAKTPLPTVELAGRKGCWDGMKLCTWCGRMNFVAVWPDGRTVVNGGPK